MAREADKWVEAQKVSRGGVMVYLPKQALDDLPIDLEEDIFVRRNLVDDNGRAKAIITIRNDIP